MISEPLRVEPVEVEYYQDRDGVIARMTRFIALAAIVYGSVHMLVSLVHLLGVATDSAWSQSMPP